jgi:hypothetical protein
MDRDLLSTVPAGALHAGKDIAALWTWGATGADILAGTSTGTHGPGLGVNDGLEADKHYEFVLVSRSAEVVVLYPDGSHTGSVPYAGSYALYEAGAGLLGTAAFSVGVATAPVIVDQPVDLAVAPGATASFTVVAVGSLPLAYQWRLDGVDIPGATASTYTRPSIAPADHERVLSVRVTNLQGSVTSAAAALRVLPVVTAQPASLSRIDGQTFAFAAAASGGGPLAYQWLRNGVAIPGAIAATFSGTAMLADDGASYALRVSNSAGQTTSSTATLTVTLAPPAPTITAQPAPVSVIEGELASLSVAAASAAPPLAYQWLRNGAPIPGATQPTFVLPAAQVADNAVQFSVRVTDALGAVATSAPAALTVLPRWLLSMSATVLLAPVDQIKYIGGFPPKRPAEVRVLAFEFRRYMSAVSSAEIAVEHSGGAADAEPEEILLGEPVMYGTRVFQRVRDGVALARYTLRCTAADEFGNTAVLSGLLPLAEP